MQNHSPLPWKFSTNKLGNGYIVAVGKPQGPIAEVLPWQDKELEAEANAAYIVQACNLYPELVDTLETVAEWCDLIEQNYPEMLFPKQVRAALAKTKESG